MPKTLILAVTAALGASYAVAQVAISKPRIAIIPMLDVSGNRPSKLLDEEDSAARGELSLLFSPSRFEIVAPQVVDQALKNARVDLTDNEQRNRATFFKLGSSMNADYIFFAAISGRGRDILSPSVGILGTDLGKSKVKLKIWLLDCKRHMPLLSSRSFVGVAASAGKYDSTEANALVAGLDQALVEFLKEFKE
jgi:hypothetical protein